MSDSPYNGFLTNGEGGDRQWLENTDEISNWKGDNDQRFAIRQRAARAIRDLAILQKELPDGNDRKLIFKTLFEENGLWAEVTNDSGRRQDHVMGNVFRLLIEGYQDYWGDKPGRPIEGRIDQWVKRGLQAAYPESAIIVDIERVGPDKLDEWEDEIRDEYGDVTEKHELHNRDLEALWKQNRINRDEYREARDDSLL